MLEYRYQAYNSGVKEQVVNMAINGSGVRDTARVLKISKTTVMSTLKKKSSSIVQINPNIQKITEEQGPVRLQLVCEEAELDEQWSFVGKKSLQRWLWYAVDHKTNTILAYVFGTRKYSNSPGQF